MDKKTVNFLFTAAIVLILFSALNRTFFPPPAVDPNAVAENGEQVPGDDDNGSEAESTSDADTEQLADSADDDPATDQPDADKTPTTLSSHKQGSLGSLDPASGFNMLVTWNNRGGSIERIELNDPKYTSVDEQFGYLGHLALSERTKGGCVVGAVGTGTPASLAKSSDGSTGIQPGDVLILLNEKEINSLADFKSAIEQTKPGSIASVVVERAGTKLTFDIELQKQPLDVVRPVPTVPTETDPRHDLSYLLEVSQIGSRSIGTGNETINGVPALADEFWKATASTNGNIQIIEFSYVLGNDVLEEIGYSGSVEIVKRYSLSPAARKDGGDGYHLNFDIELRNQTDSTLDLGYRLQGPTGLPSEGAWYAYKVHPKSFAGAGLRDIVHRFDGNHSFVGNPKIVKHARDNEKSPKLVVNEGVAKPLRYVAVDGQYFESALVPDRPELEEDPDAQIKGFNFVELACYPVGEISEERRNMTDVTFALDSQPETLQANTTFKQSFRIFAGPKKPDILKLYGLSDTISYGWFAPIAKALTAVLHFFFGIIGNYGIAIICLTILVRGCLLPFGRQQAMNAARMQELAPEMKKINEKYKDDMQKRSEAQRELFRKNSYNPLAGCLPMLLQLPIFVGLYRALSVDIELRLSPLIPGVEWCSNLAAPDQLFRWDSFMPSFLAGVNGFLGPYFNILPLFSVGLMIVHQKLFSPPPTDEQQEMQMKMMKYMMIVFGFMFFRVPAGLCLYFITSSLWAVGERKLLPKPKPKPAKPVDTNAFENASSGKKMNKENSLLSKIQDAIDQKQNPQQPTQNGAARKKERDQQRKKKRKN